MTYLFDPSLLEKLIIGPVLKGKDVTINANSKDHRYLLRPLKSTDLGMLDMFIFSFHRLFAFAQAVDYGW